MLCRGMGALPMSVALVMSVSIISTYLVSVIKGDVEAFFPYISDTGADIPESCIFSEFFNIAAFLAVSTMYLRYKLIREITSDCDARITRLAKVCFGLAIFSCLGITFVANFQETSIEIMHLIGAFLVFGLGVLYMLLDTSISYLMCPMYNGRYICRVRLAIALLGALSLFTTVIFGVVSREQWDNNPDKHKGHDRLHWHKDDPGFIAHLVSTFGEWSTAASFLFYFFTYIRDFQKFDTCLNLNLQVAHLDQVPVIVAVNNEPTEQSRLLA